MCSVVGHSNIVIPILISVGRTGSVLSVIAPCQVQIRGIDHFFFIIGFIKTGAGLVPGIMVKASTWNGLRSIAANWAGPQECRLILFRQITEQLLTR